MLRRSLESTQSLVCIDWPDTTHSIIDDEFLNQEEDEDEEMMMSHHHSVDRFGNESSMDFPPHSNLYADLEPEPVHNHEPDLISSPQSPSYKLNQTIKTSKTSVSSTCRRKKKPRGMPKRPLSAYNIFFQTQRTIVQAEAKNENMGGSKGLGFEGLGKLIGKQWKELGKEEKKKYEILAEKDSARYREEMEEYHRRKKEFREKEKNRQLASISGIVGASNHPRFVLSQPNLNASPFAPRQGNRTNDLTRNLPVLGSVAGTEVVGNPGDSSSLPVVPPPVDSSGNYLFPPGMEITMSDNAGRDQKYRVEYRCYRMTRAEANRYMDSITGMFRQSEEAHPSIPQNYIEVPNAEMASI